MYWKRRIIAVIAAAALALTLGACSGGTSSSNNVLRIGVTADIDSLNPFVSTSDYSAVVYQYSYPHLTEYDSSEKIVPSFAKSWTTSADGKTWTFHTVSGAKWSDGKPLTAKDAAFTMTMVMKY